MADPMNMTIRPTIAMAAMAASPYGIAQWLRVMVEMLLSICRIRLGKPTRIMDSVTSGSLERQRSDRRLMVRLLNTMYNKMPKLIYCEIAVDSPAPSMPSPRPNIRMGSPIILRTPPVTSPNMAKTARPS